MNVSPKQSRVALRAITSAWDVIRQNTAIGVIRDEKDYRRMSTLLDRIIDEIGSDEDHPLASLAELVGDLIERYEEKNIVLADANPLDVLRLLVEQHELRQSDLKAELGSQGVVSEILSGKRAINARQAKALGTRFGVSPAVFL